MIMQTGTIQITESVKNDITEEFIVQNKLQLRPQQTTF